MAKKLDDITWKTTHEKLEILKQDCQATAQDNRPIYSFSENR
jgi:hypothetical protein